ncbi:MAG: DHH family phosphoesterase [Candidatus Lokiarchaeota archaeon]|nr:DHH family phosphoesterase [Candidatus Lokiarchaeota archaeon]
MLTSKFEDLLTFLKNKRILITTHEPIDVDGLASGFALKYFLENSSHDVRLYFPEFTRISKIFLERMARKFPDHDFSFEKTCNLEKIDIVLIVDTSNLGLIKSINLSDTKHIFIDHHPLNIEKNTNNLKSLNIVLEDYTSAVEIISEFFFTYNIDIPLPLKWLMMSGIMTDSGFFKYANNKTMIKVASILSDDLKIQDAYLLLKTEEEYSEKMARIKGLQRLKLIQEKNVLIGLSSVSNFESMLANTLIAIGFDISIVISKKKKDPIMTVRARKEITTKIGLHLGKLMQEIASNLETSAGGHEGAASMTGIKDIDMAQNTLLKRIKQIINDQL